MQHTPRKRVMICEIKKRIPCVSIYVTVLTLQPHLAMLTLVESLVTNKRRSFIILVVTTLHLIADSSLIFCRRRLSSRVFFCRRSSFARFCFLFNEQLAYGVHVGDLLWTRRKRANRDIYCDRKVCEHGVAAVVAASWPTPRRLCHSSCPASCPGG